MTEFSVVVPTHDPRWLRGAVESALAQTERDLEVVVVPNGGAPLGGALPDDPRVRVVEYSGVPLVGAVKRTGFDAARGEVLVELDHDDILAPGALERLGDALHNSGADFAYSNLAGFRDGTWEPVAWDPHWGWKTRPVRALGHDLREIVAFEPTAESLSLVDYAPDHVRAWTREGYRRAGGHDPSLSVCDDHDLLVRTYLRGSMAHVDECLYFQRHHPGSTTRVRNGEIRSKTHEIYARNIEALVLRWAASRGLPCYDLGGALNPREGWTSVDIARADVLADLRGRWPWGDSSVGAFRAYDFLEHLPDKLHTMSEVHRCLVPGGWLLSLTPSATGQGAFMDPTHVSYWTRGSFWYHTRREFAKYIGNESVRFRAHRLVEGFPSEWHRAEGIPYVTFDGVCVKDGHEGPGPRDF